MNKGGSVILALLQPILGYTGITKVNAYIRKQLSINYIFSSNLKIM